MVHIVFHHYWVKFTYHGGCSFKFLCGFLHGWSVLCCFGAQYQFGAPMTDKPEEVESMQWFLFFSFFFLVLFGVASVYTDELNNPDHLKFQLWVECGDPHASRSLTPELFSVSEKWRAGRLRQLKGDHDSSLADCHVWYRSGSLSPPCGLDYLSESGRERLEHISGLGGVLMKTLFQFASEFIFGEMTALLLFLL